MKIESPWEKEKKLWYMYHVRFEIQIFPIFFVFKVVEYFEKLLKWLHFVTYGRFILTIQVWVIIRCLVSTLRHDDLGAVLIQILLV